MKKIILYIIIAILVLIIIAGAIYILTRKESSPEEYIMPEQVFSEQPDQGKYNEYFTESYLGKLEEGVEFDPRKVSKTDTFIASDQFCLVLTLKKQVPANNLSGAVYDTNLEQDIQPKSGFPKEVGPGGMTGCENLAWPAGQYEYKIYIDDILATILPFEVK